MLNFLKSVGLNFSKKKTLFTFSTLMGASLLITSCGNGTTANTLKIPGVDKLGVTVVQDSMLVSMVLTNLKLNSGLRYNIPKYPNSYIELSPDLESSGTLLAISISSKDVLNSSLQNLSPISLPGGRALPGVVGGKLPAVAFSEAYFKNISFYLGPKLFGFFIPIKAIGILPTIISSRYYSGTKSVGNISLVGNDANGENAGLLLMLDLTPAVKTQLLKAANLY